MNLYLEKVPEFLKLEIRIDIFSIEFKRTNFLKFGLLKKLDKLDLLVNIFYCSGEKVQCVVFGIVEVASLIMSTHRI